MICILNYVEDSSRNSLVIISRRNGSTMEGIKINKTNYVSYVNVFITVSTYNMLTVF